MSKKEKLKKVIERQYIFAYSGVKFPQQYDGAGTSAGWLKMTCKLDEANLRRWLEEAGYTKEEIENLQNQAKDNTELFKQHNIKRFE
jgi:hypothetical protein